MKRILIAALAAALFASPAYAARSIKASVNGLVCSFCAAAIEKRLKALTEVKAVYVDLTKKVVAVELKDGKDITPEKIAEEIKDSGYDVVSIARSEQTIQQIRAEKAK
jgi:mercuric ion binding protein